jgi:hypothetical protein
VRGHEDIMEMDDEGMAMLSQIFHFMKEAFLVRLVLQKESLGGISEERREKVRR